MDRTGLLIAIEGSDGSGKLTQFERLRDRLVQAGYEVSSFDFPRYSEPSSYFVRRYLSGDYGTAEDVGPYTAALFFALDRFEAAPHIKAALSAGKVVLINRYTGSNMAHHGLQFSNAEERRGFFIWLDNLEFQLLGLPRPDKSIVLRVPSAISQSLVEQKGHQRFSARQRDIHEADQRHLEQAVTAYDDLCQLFPKDFERLDAVRSGQLLDIETVHKMIWERVEPLLPAKSTIQNQAPIRQLTEVSDFYTPTDLSEDARLIYDEQVKVLIDAHNQMVTKLNAYLIDHPEAYQDAAEAARAMLPIAATRVRLPAAHRNAVLEEMAKKELPHEMAAETAPIVLNNVWPRNELELVPNIIYADSNQPLKIIKEAVLAWPYERKAKVLESLTSEDPILSQVNYAWDLITSFDDCQAFQNILTGSQPTWQALTPRYGFAVPKIIDDNDLVDLFEANFDLSLQLYSQLQSMGFQHEAQYATLVGHKARWSVRFSLADWRQHRQKLPKDLVTQIDEKLAEVHPILTSPNSSI